MVSSITSISPLDPSAAASTRAGLRAPGKDLRALAKRAGHKVVAVFTETASGADKGRPSVPRFWPWPEPARLMQS